MEPRPFNTSYRDAWAKLNLDKRKKPDEVFPRFTKKDFDELKQQYNDQHGYVIKIPGFDDIIHLTPQSLKSLEEVKAEKRKMLNQVLASPSPDWLRKFTTVMTFMDDVQDATSVIYPIIGLLARKLPKFAKKVLPILGWMMLGSDLLDLAIGVGRVPFSGLAGKRFSCKHLKQNPFHKKMRIKRANRLRNYKPSIADAIQIAQTTDNVLGIGLSLGPLMGFIQDIFTGAYRRLSGEQVRYDFEVPDMFEHEIGARSAIKASALINTRGQEFSDETHFWSLVIEACANRVYLPYCHDFDISIVTRDPMSIMIPAPYTKNQITLEVIKEAGLDPDFGYGWPINGQPEIMLGDLFDYIAENQQTSILSFWNRHQKDYYGLVSSVFLDEILAPSFLAFDPEIDIDFEDETFTRVFYSMVKAPLLPARDMTPSEKGEFFDWVMREAEFTRKPPGIIAIKEYFELYNIPYIESYPDSWDLRAIELFGQEIDINSYNFE